MKLLNIILLILSSMLLFSCKTKTSVESEVILIPAKQDFSKEVDGKQVDLFVLSGDDITVALTNYGARIVGIYITDKDGEMANVVLGFNSLEEYLESADPYFGPVVGRVGNRIAEGKFTLEGNEYNLLVNNGPNHLHGGLKGLHKVVWDVVTADEQKLVLKYLSVDMEEGYPGNLEITLTYSIENGNELVVDYKAVTDKATPVNLTNHAYYNLNGKSDIPITNHILEINADKFTPVDSTLIPTSTIDPVENTVFDFSDPKEIGKDINVDNEQLVFGGGYDHNWVLNKSEGDEMTRAAVVYSPVTGIQMEIQTEEPGIQFYSGNFFDGTITAFDGNMVEYRCGFALEPQHFPDAVNQPEFPSIILRPGDIYSTRSRHIFTLKSL